MTNAWTPVFSGLQKPQKNDLLLSLPHVQLSTEPVACSPVSPENIAGFVSTWSKRVSSWVCHWIHFHPPFISNTPSYGLIFFDPLLNHMVYGECLFFPGDGMYHSGWWFCHDPDTVHHHVSPLALVARVLMVTWDYHDKSGWWFGTFFIFPYIILGIIIPTD